MEATDGLEFYEDVERNGDLFRRSSNVETVEQDEKELLWAAIERLPSQKRMNIAIMRKQAVEEGDESDGAMEAIDVRKLNRTRREALVKNAMATIEQDNYTLLAGIKERLDIVGFSIPSVEVRFESLKVSTEVQKGKRALPTLFNFVRDTLEGCATRMGIFRPKKHSLVILNDVNGVVKPGRMTLLLGPPAAGKSTLLKTLAGKLDNDLKKVGKVTYNGHELNEFYVEATSAYVGQTDSHIGELTVRETLDVAARFQGASDKFAGYLKDLSKREKEMDIRPSTVIDAFMKASSVAGKKHSLVTDYVLRLLGIHVCADTVVGNDMLRGVSGGQKKRVTTGEMIVGPRKTLFMDEISTGLDSSTTFQIVKCIRNFVHQMQATVVIALLQPAPETFNLFDDIMLISEGHIIYQGPREFVVEFFESLGFSLPPRKGVADFLQEVTSRKDQAQYWSDNSRPYVFLTVPQIAEAFKQSQYGKSIFSTLSLPYNKTKCHPSALASTKYAVSNCELFKACFSREFILIRRHQFLYIFKTIQAALVGAVTCTMFIRTRLHPTDELSGQLYLSCLFFGLSHIMFNGISELPILISRLPVFYKQRDNSFHPAWAFCIPNLILRLPYSIIESLVWSCVVYYSVGFAPGVGSFFRYMFLLFVVHQMALGLFRLLGAIGRDLTIANTFGSASLQIIFVLSGFLLPKDEIKPWWVWGYWVSPLQYAQTAISVNEFTAPRWKKGSAIGNDTVGNNILKAHSFPTTENWYWIGIGALIGYFVVFNSLVIVAMAYLHPIGKAQAVLSDENTEENGDEGGQISKSKSMGKSLRGMTLPFQPLSLTFHNVNYFVDMPKEMKLKEIPEKRLQLLSNVSGVFRPGVLTALVGSSGAGKTTLMDVLAGRKTGGYIEGDVKISGFPKVQETFVRVSGYVEQNDIHSPQVTVEESLGFSACLRLPRDITMEQRIEFVEEVMALVELDGLRHALVGLPGSTGLSTEQRKRLTIAVELVANPSIIFMDEPTSGLDARAAAIVMRTVRNTVDTGRTVVCTIHQPSIDIFEAFDELLLMKRGGRAVYGGPLGVNSQIMINHFQGIEGVPPISEGYNPATWVLEITTPAAEDRLGEDFANLYQNSEQYREVESLIHQLSDPPPGAKPLAYDSIYSQNRCTQFKICYWKQNLVYWRSPLYNVVRLFFTAISALILGSVFWNIGSKRTTTGDIFNAMGALYAACLFLGVKNSSLIQPVVSIERTVYYRERATGMYSPFPYAAAQGLVEVPYIALQTIIYGVITYFMINFERTLGKVIMYFLFMFLTFMYFTLYGMMSVGLTPSPQMAAIFSSSFYSLWNLLSGFLVPKSRIPIWWLWFHYICPVAWTLRGIITSQLGNVETRIVGPGFDGTVKEFLKTSLDYSSDSTALSAAVLIVFCILFFTVYAVSIKILNFQRR